MTESDYFGQYPQEENIKDEKDIRKECYAKFMRDLTLAYNAVSVLPRDIQLEALMNIMYDI